MAILLSRIWINKLRQDQKGQDVTEYALLAGLMASATIAVLPEIISIAQHVVSLVQEAAQTAMNAAGLE
jgi:Flp pilus assembly pilin Flp